MSIHNMDYKKVEDEKTVKSMELLRMGFIELESRMAGVLVLSRETSLAFTKLEESLMWAIKSLAVYGCRDAHVSKVEDLK